MRADRVLVGLLAVVTPLAGATAVPDGGSLVREARMLGARHCGTRGASTLTARDGRFDLVCSPHALIGGHPESEVWRCDRDARQRWSCDDSQRATLRRVGGRTVLLSRGDAVPAQTAVDVLRFIAVTYDHTFNGRDLAAMIGGRCAVAGAGRPFAGAESYELTCGRERLTVTRDCFQGRCRLFPAALGPRGP